VKDGGSSFCSNSELDEEDSSSLFSPSEQKSSVDEEE